MEFISGTQHIALSGLRHSALFDERLIDIGSCKTVLGIYTVGSHKAFGEIVGVQHLAGCISDNSFCNTADLSADKIDAKAAPGQFQSVCDRVCYIDSGIFRNKGNHGAGRRTGININKIIRFDQGSGIFTNPLLFYAEAIPRNAVRVQIDDINSQYLAEFLEALQTSINQMSADGVRISYVASKSTELSRYMASTLDESWKNLRGMEIVSVALASISYDEESQKLINMRNQGAMMSDPTIREGYMQSAIARGLEAAGSNANGAAAGYMGMGFGMQAAGSMMGNASAVNLQQMQMNQAAAAQPQASAPQPQAAPAQAGESWTCGCGAVNTGKFCQECGSARPQIGPWTCSCGTVNTGKFCSECGKPRA